MTSLNYSLREPGVTYEVLPNPNHLLIPGGVAEVAFVGYSKATRTITNELVIRGGNNTAGNSISASGAGTTASGGTLTLDINGIGAQTITLGVDINGAAVASDIQSKVQALAVTATPPNQSAYSDFKATFNSLLAQYTLTSGAASSSSSVVVSGGTEAANLK